MLLWNRNNITLSLKSSTSKMQTSFKLAALAAVLPYVSAICNDGEVGVGLVQQCTIYGGYASTLTISRSSNTSQCLSSMNTACGSIDGTVFANDCGTISSVQMFQTSGFVTN